MIRKHFAFLLVVMLSLQSQIKAQDLNREQVFAEGEKLLNDAKENDASLYAPKTFQKGLKKYNDAAEEYGKGGKPFDVQAKLKESVQYFMKAVEVCKLGKQIFGPAMKARSDAIKVDGAKSAKDLFQDAEDNLKNATNELEESNIEDAKKRSTKAEVLFRSAELDAIKVELLSPAWASLKKADGMGVKNSAPKTLAKAQVLVGDAENLLKQDRYDTVKAPLTALRAMQEAEHAIFLSQLITQIQHGDRNLEDALVAIEEQFERVTSTLSLQSNFENGFESSVSDVLTAIKERETKVRGNTEILLQAGETIKKKDEENAKLREQISDDARKLDSLIGAGRKLQLKAELQQRHDEVIGRISAMFSPKEAIVVKDGENVIIRLRGLSFTTGKSTIDAKFYPLLTKVGKAIQEFPNSTVSVEGHTDSQGDAATNQTLSENRAKAVAETLSSNLGNRIQIQPRGFGGDKPLESNDTSEGRAQNRRIDIVITPEWASAGK